MKATFELNLDTDGRPCIKFRHYDEDESLEQKALGIFLNAIEEKGVELKVTDNGIDKEGIIFTECELQIRKA